MRNPFQKIAFIGLGYVGLCTAVTFASKGFEVVGVDVDAEKVEAISSGNAPFHEPGLDRLLKKTLRSRRLTTTTEIAETGSARCTFITVGTPSSRDGSIDLSYVMEALEEVGGVLRDSTGYHLVVVKSTVIPGTTRAAIPKLEAASGKSVGDEIGVCTNPEFLKEGSAIKDTLQPDKIVIGAFDPKSANELRKLYWLFHKRTLPPIITTTPQTAEMVKYASNAFLATKVSFINTIADICQRTPGVDVEEVARAIGLDPRIGPLFLKAGPGYGGSCFHKDLQALIHYSQDNRFNPQLLQATEQVNHDQAEQVVGMAEEQIGSLKERRVAVLGLSFKKDTDDIREAASLRLIEKLKRKGAQVVAYDPMAMPNAKRVLANTVEFARAPDEALKGADICILMTEWDEFRRIKPKNYLALMRTPNLVDARRLYNPREYQELAFAAIGLGPASRHDN